MKVHAAEVKELAGGMEQTMQLLPEVREEFREQKMRFAERMAQTHLLSQFPIRGLTTTYSLLGLTTARPCASSPSYLLAFLGCGD